MNTRQYQRRIAELESKAIQKRFVCIDGETGAVRIGGQPVDYQRLPGDIVIRINRVDTMDDIGVLKSKEAPAPPETPDGPAELIEDHPPSGGRPIFPVASVKDSANCSLIDAVDKEPEVGPVPQPEPEDPAPPILADETGKSPATIRTAIDREDKNQTSSLTKLSGTDKHRPHTPLEEKQPAPVQPSKWFRRA